MQKYWLNSLILILILSFSTAAFSKQESFKTNATDQVSCSAARYNIVDLGSLDNNVNQYTFANQLNNLGNSVGGSSVSQGVHAFYYTNNGGMQDIHPNNMDTFYSQAQGINDRNHIVGSGAVTNSTTSAEIVFYYDQQTVQQIAHSDSPEFISPADINSNDEILLNKSNYSATPPLHTSYVWQNGQTILSFQADGQPFLSQAMNDSRVIVGYVYSNYPAAYVSKGFVWQNGQLRLLSTIDNNNNTLSAQANNLNNASTVIVGYSQKTMQPMSVLQHPVYWNKTNTGDYVIRDILDNASTNQGMANAVNTQKVIVGEVALQNGSDRHAFLYDVQSSALVDLRTRVNYMGSRVLESARDINDHCQILVNGRDAQGHPVAFRLDPIGD